MFCRHPCLTIDAFLGLQDRDKSQRTTRIMPNNLKKEWLWHTKKQKNRLSRKGQKYKKYYDGKVRYVVLEPCDRVLVRWVEIQEKHKPADLWEADPYIIRSQPIPDVPVLRVEKENSSGKFKLQHRNMLLPFHGLPSPFSEPSTPRKATTPAPNIVGNSDTSSSCSDTE